MLFLVYVSFHGRWEEQAEHSHDGEMSIYKTSAKPNNKISTSPSNFRYHLNTSPYRLLINLDISRYEVH
jgi:hypothetical protein